MIPIRAVPPVAVVVAVLSACDPAVVDPPPEVSPYPGVTVSGTVVDVRGAAVMGAHVVVWNSFDTGSTNTAADGTFSLTMDGSASASYFEVTHAGFRTRDGGVSVGATGAAMGNVGVVSKQEILVASLGGDVWLVRADGAHPNLQLTSTPTESEWTPCFSPDGLTVRWANVTTDEIEEAAWNGSGVHVVRSAETGWALQGIEWSERGTVAWRSRDSDGANGAVIVESLPGAPGGFSYTWPGFDAAASPPAFGWFGPTAIDGNMISFAGGDGIYTAFPYFTDTFFVPEKVAGTLANDVRPAWSPFRADGTLHLGLLRDYRVFWSEVTAGSHTNVYSTPAALYGNVTTAGSEQPRVADFDWAPETAGQADRIALVVHPFGAGAAGPWGAGDVIVIDVDPATGDITSGPTIVYDASAAGGFGSAMHVSWR